MVGSSLLFALTLAFALLTVNFGYAMYQAREDKQSVLFIAGSYGDLVLLLGIWRLGYIRQPPPRGKSPENSRLLVVLQVLEGSVMCLTVLLAFFLPSQLRRILPPRTSELLLVLVVAAAALVACLFFFLHKLGWLLNQPSHEVDLPLVQLLPKHESP